MIKILDIDNIKLVSVNNKYLSKSFRLTKQYRDFKKILELSVKKIDIKPPQRVKILLETALDIDNSIKPILDGIEKVFSNDRHIEELIVIKKNIKKGKAGRLQIFAENIKKVVD